MEVTTSITPLVSEAFGDVLNLFTTPLFQYTGTVLLFFHIPNHYHCSCYCWIFLIVTNVTYSYYTHILFSSSFFKYNHTFLFTKHSLSPFSLSPSFWAADPKGT